MAFLLFCFYGYNFTIDVPKLNKAKLVVFETFYIE